MPLQRGSTAWRRQAAGALPPNTYVKTLEEHSDVLFCGWSTKKGGPADLFSYSRYFALTKTQELLVYEMPRGTEELKLAGKMALSGLSAIKREKPNSESDFTFRIVTEEATIKINPGSRTAFQQWQEGLMAAVAVPSPQEQRRSIMRRESLRESPGGSSPPQVF